MSSSAPASRSDHGHVFLGADHARNERRTWAVIVLCGAMMVLEIGGGLMFGSVALIADGLHMSTHAGALFLAAMAYSYARKHADDARFTFGTGKMGDLAAFASAIVLAMISLLIAYEALMRLLAPVAINFPQAIGIAALGLLVNVASVWILGGGHPHDHSHDHSHHHGHGDHDHAGRQHGEESRRIDTLYGPVDLAIEEDGAPPRFRISFSEERSSATQAIVETMRAQGARQSFRMEPAPGGFASIEIIPEPHEFSVRLRLEGPLGISQHETEFHEAHVPHDTRRTATRDNNMRAALVHVMADAAVSCLVICGLGLAWAFHWLWIDPLVGMVGALVVANWAYGLMRDAGAILLDMNPDTQASERIRTIVEESGDRLADLHVWRLGPGHLGAIVEITSPSARDSRFYRDKLAQVQTLSHLTIEVRPQ